MRKFIAGLIFYFASLCGTQAGVSCALPFVFTNNTVADANQVMANYNAIVTCLGNAAAAGINSDITSLVGLSTPLPPSEGGTAVYIAGTSTGSANAQIVTTTTPSGYGFLTSSRVVFVAGFTNTGATTLQIGVNSPATVVRLIGGVLQSLQGGEITVGQVVDALWNGGQFQLAAPISLPVGTVLDYAGPSAPSGFLFASGQCVSQTTFVQLFGVIGSIYSAADGCGGSNFGIPDLRGRASVGVDVNNGGGFANRVTVAGGNFDSTVLGGAGGQQNWVLTQAQLPVFTPAGTVSQITPVGTNSAPTFTGSTFTPAGTNSAPAFTGTPMTATLGASASLGGTTQSYTPAGTNGSSAVAASGANNITVTISYTNRNDLTGGAAQTAVSTINSGGGGGASANSVATSNSISVAGTATAQAFTGTAANITLGALATFGGTTQSFTPAGSVAAPTFTGTGAAPTGSVSAPAFTGTPVTPTFTGNSVGSGNSHPTLGPVMVLNKIIKY